MFPVRWSVNDVMLLGKEGAQYFVTTFPHSQNNSFKNIIILIPITLFEFFIDDPLDQWLPTGVPRHNRVPWPGARGAANIYNSFFFYILNPFWVPPNIYNIKGAANKTRLGNTALDPVCLLSVSYQFYFFFSPWLRNENISGKCENNCLLFSE